MFKFGHKNNQFSVKLDAQQFQTIMKAFDNLTAAIAALTAVVATVPTSGGGTAGGATEAQVQDAADKVNEQTAILKAALGGAGVPVSPVGLASISSPGVVVLNFERVPGALSYNIKRSGTSGAEVTVGTVANPETGAVTFQDSPQPVGVPVFYVVSAVNAAGESANSAEITVTP